MGAIGLHEAAFKNPVASARTHDRRDHHHRGDGSSLCRAKDLMDEDGLRSLLLQLSPSTRDKLRTVLIRDDRDEIASELLP